MRVKMAQGSLEWCPRLTMMNVVKLSLLNSLLANGHGTSHSLPPHNPSLHPETTLETVNVTRRMDFRPYNQALPIITLRLVKENENDERH